MNVCINQILLPPLIKQTVGAKNKELALGQVTSLCAAIHAIEPFLGAISDRARCSFRKRAFILFGQSCTCLGVAGFWYVDHLPEVDTSASTGGEEVHSHGVKWHLLVLAYFCLHLGNMVGWIPYIAIIPEMAPSQRGQAAGIIGVVGGACAYCGSLLGGAIGENWITHDEAFALMLILNVLNIPIGCLVVQGAPGTCKHPFQPEKAPPPLSAEDAGRSCISIICRRLSSPSMLWAMGREFLSAFTESPAYARKFLCAFVSTLNPFGTFIFYWYSDCFAPHFDFFGVHITSSTQTAVAVLTAMEQLLSTITSLPGGLIDARYLGNLERRKNIILLNYLVGIPLGLIYLRKIDFTVVILLKVWLSLTDGLLKPANVAFQADCLPAGPDGLPKDPTRDTLLFGWSSTLSGIVMPLAGGAVFNVGWSKQLTYHYMFIWAIILSSIVTAIFASIPTQKTHDSQSLAGARARPKKFYRAPLGAKLCDELCCGETIAPLQNQVVGSIQ